MYSPHSATYVADSGYHLVGQPVLNCTSFGLYDAAYPECRVICPVPTSISNGTYTLSDNVNASTIYEGISVTYTCATNFYLNGTANLNCTNGGVYTSAPPVCLVACTEVLSLVGGSITTETTPVLGNSSVNYTCNDGFLMLGNTTRTCLSNHHYDMPAPTCKKLCSVPPSISSGSYTAAITPVYDGVSVSYSCNSGFIITGLSIITCTSSGSYNSAPPSCDLNIIGVMVCPDNVTDPCLNGGSCFIVNEVNTICQCQPGYEGDFCQTPTDECEPARPCHYTATCIDDHLNFTCICAPGYTGKLCDIDINECESEPCGNGTCLDFVNGYNCLEAESMAAAESVVENLLVDLAVAPNAAYDDENEEEALPAPAPTPESMKANINEFIRFLLMEAEVDVRKSIGYQQNETIISCGIGGDDCIWTSDYHPQYGNCFLLNGNLSNRMITHRAGMEQGLFFALNSKPELYSELVDSLGFKLTFHTPEHAPFPEYEGFTIVPQFLNIFTLKYTVVDKIRPPIGNCITGTEQVPQYYYPGYYSEFGCELSYKQKETIDYCNCTNPKLAKPSDVRGCRMDERSCVQDVEMGKYYNGEDAVVESLVDICRPACWYEKYEVSSTKTRLVYKDKKDLDKYNGMCQVIIYFESMAYTHMEEVISYDLTDWLSNTGGLLGLTVGLSVISMLEIVIMIIDRIRWSVHKLALRFV